MKVQAQEHLSQVLVVLKITGSSLTYSITAGIAMENSQNLSIGVITTAAGLSFKDAKSYTLTLTASGGGETTSTNVVVPIQNSEDLASASVRFSTVYHSASRNGFSATATRGPSGSQCRIMSLNRQPMMEAIFLM